MKTIILCWLLMPINAWAVSPFQQYGDEFMRLANEHGISTEQIGMVKIRFGTPRPTELSSRNLGYCNPEIINGYRVIEIDESQWDLATDQCRRALIYHEMAHCALKKEHTEGGLMAPRLNCLATTKKDIAEMFSGPVVPGM